MRIVVDIPYIDYIRSNHLMISEVRSRTLLNNVLRHKADLDTVKLVSQERIGQWVDRFTLEFEVKT